MTIRFAPHVRHVADQHRDQAADEYGVYILALRRLEAHLDVDLPAISREEYDDMRELLEARHGITP